MHHKKFGMSLRAVINAIQRFFDYLVGEDYINSSIFSCKPDNAYKWWLKLNKTCKNVTGTGLSYIALKLFGITLHAANMEHLFSVLG